MFWLSGLFNEKGQWQVIFETDHNKENEGESRGMQRFSHLLVKNQRVLNSEVPAAEICHLQKCGSVQELDSCQRKIAKTTDL